MEHAEVQYILDSSPLFHDSGLDDACFTKRRYQSGRVIDDRPDGVPSVGLVASGRVDVYSIAADGRDVRLSTLRPGDCFGIYNLVTDTELGTVLRCEDDPTILYISKTAMLECMEMNPQLAFRYAKICNEKLQFLISRIGQLTMQTCRGKLIVWLLANQSGGKVAVSSKEELARCLGISRAALFRELSALQSQGALSPADGALQITDVTLLERMLYQPSISN